MNLKQEPKAIRRSLIIVAKFGFISKKIFFNFLTTKNLSHKYKLWHYFKMSGYFVEYNRIGVAENYYYLSNKAISGLTDVGIEAVSKAHPLHFEHDEIVMNFVLASENSKLIKDVWQSDKTLRQMLPNEQLELTGRILDKIPDLLFEASIENLKLIGALEVERCRKSKTRYDSFVLNYLKYKNLGLVLVAYNNRSVVKSIQDAVKRLGYPQRSRPIIFCQIEDLLKNQATFEVEVNENKIRFDLYIQNIRKIVSEKPENLSRKISGSNSGNSSEVA